MIIQTPNLNEVRKQIQKLRKQIQKLRKENPNEKIIVKAQDEEFNRKIVEDKNVNILLSPEIHFRKDRLKQRDSGLNEVLCKLAAKNNIKIAIDLSEIMKLPKKEKAIILSRIIQNIKLCKRTKAQIILYPKNKYKKQDILSFFQTLKASSEQAKKAFNF